MANTQARGQRKRRMTATAGMISLLVLAGRATAGDCPVLEDRFEVSLGSFFTALDTTASLETDFGELGDRINLEDDLGLDNRDSVVRVGGVFRLAGRHDFSAGYFSVGRTSTKLINRDINWGDQNFHVGAEVKSHFESSFPALHYTYWFMRREKYAVGARAGLVLLGIDLGIEATGSGGASGGRSVSTSVPVPLIGAEFRYLPWSWLMVKGVAGYITDFSSAQVWNAGVAAEGRVYKWIWLGVAYDRLSFRLDSTFLKAIDGTLKYTVGGANTYVRLGF